mgnify:CR=1 FL=1
MHPMRLLWKNVQHCEQYLHVGWVNFALIFLIHHDVVTRAMHDAAAAADGQAIAEEPDKQQVQLAAFNEYLHLCRDLYKSDPAMVSQIDPMSYNQIWTIVTDTLEDKVPKCDRVDRA